MDQERIKAGILTINRQPPVTDPQEAKRLIAQDVLKRARQARSHFHVVEPEKRTWNGIVFASWHEMIAHKGLTHQEQEGLISNLRRQVKYELWVSGVLIGRYVADHVWFDNTLQREVVADSKQGKRTETFIMKKRLMRVCHGIDVVEI